MTEKDMEFLKRWLMLLDIVCPEARGATNSASIAMTDKYIAKNKDGQIEIASKFDPL